MPCLGTSLVVQQVRFHAPKAGVPDFILGWGTTTVYLRLELERTWLGLEPSQNTPYLVSGPNEAQVLDASLQTEFSERQDNR